MTPDEFRQRMAALPEPPADSHAPLWDYWRHDLWTKAQTESAYSFMGWPCVYHTMLQNHWPEVVKAEIAEMTGGFGDFLPRITEIPNLFYPYDREDVLLAKTMGSHVVNRHGISRNLAHQFYHLWKWQQVTGRKVADLDIIIEFGGGYGAMALVARRLGFHGLYEIVDLPEFLILQQFFIEGATDEKHSYIFTDTFSKPVAHSQHDLVIAGYSLSETDYARRDLFFAENHAGSYLLWYSNRFEDFDNLGYFQNRLPALLPDLAWKHWQATHMPPETWYSIGYKP